ncbi:hypothetical protein CEXT_587981 [Caerostris extrusa]|uniref:Uncharacterized protein n=1 Tax=Caerostris extrusa TaxID=172846 RepID=A0AAV4VMX2_CAEEX|nr:hypothetical protein CEXT_587981 [Caerostris extrusa]
MGRVKEASFLGGNSFGFWKIFVAHGVIEGGELSWRKQQVWGKAPETATKCWWQATGEIKRRGSPIHHDMTSEEGSASHGAHNAGRDPLTRFADDRLCEGCLPICYGLMGRQQVWGKAPEAATNGGRQATLRIKRRAAPSITTRRQKEQGCSAWIRLRVSQVTDPGKGCLPISYGSMERVKGFFPVGRGGFYWGLKIFVIHGVIVEESL